MDALSTYNGPNITIIYNLPLNSPVLVWREGNTSQAGFQLGLYSLFNINGEICIVKLSYEPTDFYSTIIKPYLTDLKDKLINLKPKPK